ncbi:hypothetical protein PITC_072770 [Penicillium italicum]|uniref:Uncharacterized protein n=1 Tax=Penicillium italicum TaxID=40296 RepID=A0A0A2L5G3_PENIT|nr:hypothetical protein PITC_072770 [Penicillium italicum]
MIPVEIRGTLVESVVNSPFTYFKELLFYSLYTVALEVIPKEEVF